MAEPALENVTKRSPDRPSKAERDAADIAAAAAMPKAAPKAPETDPPAEYRGIAFEDPSEPVPRPSVAPKADTFELYANVPPGKTRAMELLRNYRPSGPFEVVGYTQPEIRKKNPLGVMEVVQAKKFIKGEIAPSAVPGVVVEGKIWAGTVIKVDVAEAKRMKTAGIAEASLEDD